MQKPLSRHLPTAPKMSKLPSQTQITINHFNGRNCTNPHSVWGRALIRASSLFNQYSTTMRVMKNIWYRRSYHTHLHLLQTKRIQTQCTCTKQCVNLIESSLLRQCRTKLMHILKTGIGKSLIAHNVRYSKVAHIRGFFSSYLRFLCLQCIGSF